MGREPWLSLQVAWVPVPSRNTPPSEMRAEGFRLDLSDMVGASHLGPEMLRGLEHGHEPGGNLHRITRPGVPGHPGLSLPDLEGSKSPNLDILTLGKGQLHGVQESVHHQGTVFFCYPRADGLCDLLHQVRLRHPFLREGEPLQANLENGVVVSPESDRHIALSIWPGAVNVTRFLQGERG